MMRAIFITFQTDMSGAKLAAKKRSFKRLLNKRGVEFENWAVGGKVDKVLLRLESEGRGLPVIVVDDEHGLPNEATWLAGLTQEVEHLPLTRRPQVVYVTSRHSANGRLQAQTHPVVRNYFKRDEDGLWVEPTINAVLEIVERMKVAEEEPASMSGGTSSDIVGESPRFLEAVEQLSYVLRSPYGLVTGEQGAGKMFLIRAMWRELRGLERITVLPCGSFFKDVYVGDVRRRIGGGREAIDQLHPFLEEAQDKLLVLHHVEQLPTALQEELVVRLPSLSGNPENPHRLTGVDKNGLAEYDLSIVATSIHSPEVLAQTGRVIPELLDKISKRTARIPSLLERGPQDIRPLCEDVVCRISIHQGLSTIPKLSEKVIDALSRSLLPGNISDLVRILEQAIRRAGGGPVRLSDLPDGLIAAQRPSSIPTLKDVVLQAKKTAVENALLISGGDVKGAAELLDCDKGTIYRLMKELGISQG